MAKTKKNEPKSAPQLSDVLRLPQGPVNLANHNPRATPGFPGKKSDAPRLTEATIPLLSDLQERLFAQGRSTPQNAPRVLVVLQGMDTSGKGGIIRHAIGLVDPQGVHIKSFKAPTEEERAHDFLWRIEKEIPQAGMIGIFDRSHYEDVLIVRVENLVPEDQWQARYEIINEFEAKLVDQGVHLIKCFLNVSKDEQKQRLTDRLADPSKYWKYNPGDLDARAKWDAYQEAYTVALEKCNTDAAPWHVIPSDRKWYCNWAVAELLKEKLQSLQLEWPAAEFDVEVERQRVAAS